MPKILDSVKMTLRITHKKLDADLIEVIGAAKREMIRAGVSPALANKDCDPLIREAIKMYCRLQFTSDMQKHDRYSEAWQTMLDSIRRSKGYGWSDGND